MDAYQEVFREEADELLAELEAVLLEIEQRPEDLELVARAFRAMHTIKGSGAMFGFEEVAAFTHDVETVFDRVRRGELPVDRKLIDLGLGARDHIRALLAETAPPGAAAALLATFHEGPPEATEKPADRPPETPGTAPEAAAAAAQTTYRIRFRPAPDLLQRGTDPLALFEELARLGSSRVLAQTDRVPTLEACDPEQLALYWDVLLTTGADLETVRDAFVFVDDESEVQIEALEVGLADPTEGHRRLGQILVARGDISAADLEDALRSQKKVGEILCEQGRVSAGQVAAALEEQKATSTATREAPTEAATSIRVSADKLDKLVDLVGELVIAQARLTQTAANRSDADLLTISESIERLTSELRDNTLNIRMLPIGTTFSRFRRLVRDLSSELGKEVVLETEGAETELDKTVIERLADPLVHLIRNCIDHGIESPATRAANGKPRHGTIHLSATHSEASVVIRINDDGAGLDPERIRAKAVANGLVAADAQLSNRELFQLIFGAGFSTAEKVSNVSGRGVGMDVVRRSIEALRGSVELNSEPGHGTTVSIRLPLTLAIIEGLLVEVADESYVLPLSIVEECVELTRAEVEGAHGRQMAAVRGELVPYVRLREWFHRDGARPEIEQIVIAELDDTRFGFVVDAVVGQHQTVIKTLGRLYQGVPGLSGATILGDGTVALILDAPRIVASLVA